MALLDFILNLAGLLGCLNWRAAGFETRRRPTAATLAATLKRAAPAPWRAWRFPAGVALLVVLRAILYRQLGPTVDWAPKLDLSVVVVAFRNDHFLSVLLFSCLSLVRLVFLAYTWLLALVVINRPLGDTDPVQRLVQQQFGGLARWPWPVQALLPLVSVLALWLATHPLLVTLGVTNPVRSWGHLLEQGLLVGGSVYLSLKYLLPLPLFLHLILSYIYLGTNPLWEFVSATARHLLRPLRPLPLRLGKFDFAPLVGVVLVFLLLDTLPAFIIRRLSEGHWTVWPQ